MSAPSWIIDLNGLLAQFSHLGLSDVAGMNLNDLWGVYRYLKSLKEMQE
jgi:hypothetical protein